MNWRIVVACLLILTSGCVVPEPFNASTSVSFSGDFETNETHFRMSGPMVQQRGSETLDDISVCGYSEQEELLFAESLPPFDRSTDVTIRSSVIPHYIIIYSEEFWESNKFWEFDDGAVDVVKYYESRDGSGYGAQGILSKSELPIDTDRPKQNGCPT